MKYHSFTPAALAQHVKLLIRAKQLRPGNHNSIRGLLLVIHGSAVERKVALAKEST